ncbi:MAG: flagellar biosynthetic protein FliO [Ruminococcus sp.]|jgi:flagellar biogenesis protein FliO|nr:flagellar biosynthetic protein FliO [Ruminococcus sp.]
MPDTLSVLFALVGVIAIIIFMFWAARWFQKKYGFGFTGSGKLINIKDTVSITPDTRLVIAETGGKRYLIGVGNVRLLGELGATEAADDGRVTETAAETGEALETEKKSIFTRSEKMPIGEAFKIVLAEKLSAKKEDD